MAALDSDWPLLTLERTDSEGAVSWASPAATSAAMDLKLSHETEALWLGRGTKEADKTDGVVVLPYAAAPPYETRPVCWFFCMDISGSMDIKVSNRRLTLSRWNIACQLFQKVVDDLMASGRPQDTMTVVCFNNTVTVICNNLTLYHVQQQKVVERLLAIKPKNQTNIQLANSALHSLMLTNPHLSGTHRAAEIFFTDGEATEGETDTQKLQQQKSLLYRDLVDKLHLEVAPFLWCGAISDAAHWQVVRALSQASSISLWAFIRDKEMENFAGEVGGVVAAVTRTRLAILPPLGNDRDPRTVMLLPDTDNMYYCSSQPEAVTKTVEAPSLITLFKIRCILEGHASGTKTFGLLALNHCVARLKARNKTQDAFVSTSIKWSQLFDKMQTELLRDLEDMTQALTDTGTSDLHRQISGTRDAFTWCAPVAAASANYTTAFLTPKNV